MTDEDAGLVARSLAGDTTAYAVLMRRHFALAFATARGITAVAEDAEDACAEAFARAYFRLADCRMPDHFRGWLLQIVRRQALNVKRYQALRAAVALTTVPEPAMEDLGPPETVLDDVRLRHALDALTPIRRAVVMHHDIDGWTHRQVASALGISVFMSRRHLSDARALLRDLLGDFKREGTSDE